MTIFNYKYSFVLTVAVIFFGCLLGTTLAVGQSTGTTEKTETEKAADFKKYIEQHPLVVIGVEPYVAEHKGILGTPGTPAISGTPAIPDKPATPGTPATPGKPATPETPAKPATAGTPGNAGMGDRIAVVIYGLSQAAKYNVEDPTKLVLFVNGRVFKEVHPESVGWDRVVFKLERTTDALDAWNGLLGSPGLNPLKPIKVSVGYADQQPWNLAVDQPNLNLIVYRRRWAVGSLIILILMLLVFWKYSGRDLLRDSGPPKPAEGKKRPYSLAKVQVAWWFFLVIGCFLLIYLITGEFTMTEQALILIGIGTGTALGSAMIDDSKRKNADNDLETLNPQKARLEAEIAQLNVDIAALQQAITANQGANDGEKAVLIADKESLKTKQVEFSDKSAQLQTLGAKIADATEGLTKPTSGGLWTDLVTDASGPSFHRFQMIAWTVILGILFLAGVYKNLAMPEFKGTMLALMGISAGTYLGFKIPEKQSDSSEQVTNPPAGAAPGQGGAGAAPGQAAANQAAANQAAANQATANQATANQAAADQAAADQAAADQAAADQATADQAAADQAAADQAAADQAAADQAAADQAAANQAAANAAGEENENEK